MDPSLVDKIIAGDSAASISDYIKDQLFSRTAEKIDNMKPEIASSIFGDPNNEPETEVEVETEQTGEE